MRGLPAWLVSARSRARALGIGSPVRLFSIRQSKNFREAAAIGPG
jgi:hypothetical protein